MRKVKKATTPMSFRVPEDELRFYREKANKRGIKLTDLVLEALREKYFPDGHDDIEWLGHA